MLSRPLVVREQAAYLWLRRLRDRLVAPLAAPLARLRVPPAAVSCAGVALAASLAWSLPGHPRLALAAFAAALLCDAVDGAVARRLEAGPVRRRDKWVDQLCDTATLMALLAATAAAGLASPRLCAAAAGGSALVLALAFALHAVAGRQGPGSAAGPRGGFFAHLPKVPFYGALAIALAGGTVSLDAALRATVVLAAAGAAGFAAALVWRLNRR